MKIKKLTIFSLVVFMLMSLILTSCGGTEEVNFTADNYLQGQMPKKGDEIAIIKTNMGEMKVMLFPKYAPKAVENFTTLAKEGKYDGIIFHRVVNDFMIQTGITNDGTVSKWGSSFEIETTDMLHHFKGALSMANTGRANSNSSQFFIVQRGPVSDQYIQYFQNNNYINNDEVAKVYKSVGGTPDLDAVSYTHLDVYKRQRLSC